MDKVLTFKEFMQREIPAINRQWAVSHPLTALINLVIPLLKEKKRLDTLQQLNDKIKLLEKIANKKVTAIESWMNSPKTFIKIQVTNKWGKKIPKKIYKKEIEEEITSFITWVFSDIIFALLYKGELDISEMKRGFEFLKVGKEDGLPNVSKKS